MSRLRWIIALVLLSVGRLPAQAPLPSTAQLGLSGLREVPFDSLSSTAIGPLGQAALTIRPGEWKHAETDNFIYHFFHNDIATAVSVEAEFYYHLIAQNLDKDTSHWERKAHIFIFEGADDWKAFQSRAKLDPWTGGIHSNNEVFLPRDPNQRFKGNTLAHETAHLVVNRFFGAGVPLWLNEGYAEYISTIAYANFYRARGYAGARPRFRMLPNADYSSVKELTERVAYPTETPKVIAFYLESEVLVRFLDGEDKGKFLGFFDSLSKGALFQTALQDAYGSRFSDPAAFEDEFRRYANSYLMKKE